MVLAEQSLATDNPFAGYSYAYPHKSAYRALAVPAPLEQVWSEEQRNQLFLYFHLPFCEYRCGFCNLFTLAQANQDLVTRYLSQLETEANTVRSAVPDAQFAQIAIGGGTPTLSLARALAYLHEQQ